MGGTQTADTKTTTQQLTPEQQRLAAAASGQYDAFAASNPTLPTGDAAVSPFDPNQVAGQEAVLGQTGNAAQTVGTAAGTNREIAGGEFLDPGSNKTLPGVAANASTGSGGISANFGGSRQGVIEALATKDANEAAGNTGAGIANAALQHGLDATNTAIAQAPTSAASLAVPGTMQSTVGDVRQQQGQNVINANNAALQLQQWLPAIKAQLLAQGAGALPGGSTTSTGTSNTSANPFQTAIGGAAAAGGLAGGLSKLLPLLMI
jgi:hypothetical protein